MKHSYFAAALVFFAFTMPAFGQVKKGPPNHGIVLAAAMEVAPVKLKDTTDLALTKNYVFRGRIITLNKEKTAHLCFDTEHMRVAGAWIGPYPAYPANKNMGPIVEGEMVFATKPGPGWAKDKDWKDPRPHPEGPLPRGWAHYTGLYLHDDAVVLAYTVGDAKILELPGSITVDGRIAITRTFRIGPTSTTQSLLVCEEDGLSGASKAARADAPVGLSTPRGTIVAGLIDAPKGATWEAVKGRIHLHLPSSPKETLFTLVVANLPKDAGADALAPFLKAKTTDPATLLKGGVPRWKKTFETKGILGSTDKEPYVVDQILLPEGNPYHASIRLSGLDFFKDGRAAICTWDGDVWIVSGLDEKLVKITWKRFAAGLQQPLGLKIIDGVIYTAGRDQITRLHDLNGDGEADFYENFNNDAPLTLQRHEFVMDLQTDAAGNLYYCRSGHYIISPSGANCCVYKLPSDGSKLEMIARGFREPNGMGIGPDGTLTVGDNEGNGIPQTPLYHLKPGAFYGYKPQTKPGAAGGSWSYTEKPIVWLAKNVDRSAGGQVWVTSDRWGPLKGQLLHLSYGHCLLYGVLLDKKAEPWQGAVWKFPVNFYSGVMRARFSPADGQLYLCGLRGWDTTSTKDGQLARVRYTGKKMPIPTGIEVTKKGINVTFTDPLDKASAEDDQNWGGEWYEGIAKASPLKAKQEMPITAVRLSRDGKTVSIELETIQPISNYMLQYRIRATDGGKVSGQLHGTIHRIP